MSCRQLHTWRLRPLFRYTSIRGHGSLAASGGNKPVRPMAASYSAKQVEEGWYDWWEQQGFHGKSSSDYAKQGSTQSKAETFTMITPPPNVTGSLHIGHALTFSLEDATVRWRRMRGDRVQWIPGTDHAGIGTQSVVEKMLMRDKGLTRHDLGRDAFVDQIWQWRKTYGDRILQQVRRIGASVDWPNAFFTMDDTRYEAVQNAFIRLYNDNMIYRDTRLVNWCCKLETVISDIEVDYVDVHGSTKIPVPGRPNGVEFGVLHEFAYPVVDASADEPQELVIATTRIETMLGDCAVAVHPDDPRYKTLHGKHVYHPILKKELPIVCDDQLVDMEFGTGVVKITPAHDPNDYTCAKRHALPIVSIFDKEGKLNGHCGVPDLVGKDRFDVRETVIERLQQLKYYRGKNDKHEMRVALCSRSGDVIEPLLQPQWYLRCSELAEICKKQVKQGVMTITPAHHEQEWFRWLDNIQDWCISRQLWWGHEIPAYKVIADAASDKDMWVAAKTDEDAKDQVSRLFKQLGLAQNTPFKLEKDGDVLDTWFSSGLLPLSALGWRGNTNDPIPTRYPLQVMETGFDILFFWVARMAMLGNYFTQSAPFKEIVLHGMVRDAQGRKMSKSLGNVIDPLHVIDGVDLDTLKQNVLHGNLAPKEIETSVRNLENEYPQGIPACGTDSLRFALISYTRQARQINLDINNVVQTSHFCNKLWNLFKYGLPRLEAATTIPALPAASDSALSLVNRYMLSRLADAVAKVDRGFHEHRLCDATDAVRHFIVDDVCDVYVEFSKIVLNNADIHPKDKDATLSILNMCMDVALRLAHPFMPFVTEELWQQMKQVPGTSSAADAPSIMVERFPLPEQFDAYRDIRAEDDFKVILSIIHASRSVRQNHQISVGTALPFVIECQDAEMRQGSLMRYLDDIKKFVKASSIDIQGDDATSTGVWTSKVIDSQLKIKVPSSEILRAQLERASANGTDMATVIKQRQQKIEKKMAKVTRDFEKLRGKMARPGYKDAVPDDIKTMNTEREALLALEIDTLTHDLATLAAFKE